MYLFLANPLLWKLRNWSLYIMHLENLLPLLHFWNFPMYGISSHLHLCTQFLKIFHNLIHFCVQGMNWYMCYHQIKYELYKMSMDNFAFEWPQIFLGWALNPAWLFWVTDSGFHHFLKSQRSNPRQFQLRLHG